MAECDPDSNATGQNQLPGSSSTNEKIDQMAESNAQADQGKYFWDRKLHEEFMRHFSCYGKTWKVISQKLSENGILNKDQLQCRTHGQKYLLGLEEIRDSIKRSQSTMLTQQQSQSQNFN